MPKCHRWPSEAIRGDQRRSEAIRGHKCQLHLRARMERGTSSAVIISHQQSSAVISRHQPSSAVIMTHLSARMERGTNAWRSCQRLQRLGAVVRAGLERRQPDPKQRSADEGGNPGPSEAIRGNQT